MKKLQKTIDKILLYTLIASVFIALYLVFIWSPIEKIMGESQKIFYFHVGCAWIGFLAFFIVGYYSVRVLIKPSRHFHIVAGASAEIGLVFIVITLLTGMIWGRSSWNTWWSWEPRLVTTIILVFIYIAYFLVRQMDGSWEKISRLSAVFGIIGCLNVPIVFGAIRWWNTKLHPIVFGEGKSGSGGGLESSMLMTMFFCIFTITIFYIYFMRQVIETGKMRLYIEERKQKLMDKIV